MALSCFFSSQVCASLRIDYHPRLPPSNSCNNEINQRYVFCVKTTNKELFAQPVTGKEVKQYVTWSFLRGSRINYRPNLGRNTQRRKSSRIHASWLASSQIASSAFTLGTVAVLPFYTFMVVAPQAQFTKKVVASSIPYIILGVLYAYLLYLSWTPDTILLMFASKYWLPELPGITKMFASEMTLASAWIHLLAVDLFAARQVYFDGLRDNTETRHSVSLCLLFCPIGILSHLITKAVAANRGKTGNEIH